jgi:hypothetical protein
LKDRAPYRGFKGKPIERQKSMNWPRRRVANAIVAQ